VSHSTEGVNMKRFLYITFSALMLSTSAYADTWQMPNNAGGQIIATDRPCPKYPKLFEIYSRGSDGTTINGCYVVYDGWVHVSWNDGTERTYDPKMFIKMQGT